MKRVYIDGVYDLFHVGHITTLEYCKNMFGGENTFLIVGVINDLDATSYKRQPIINEKDRYTIIQSLKVVDEVIENAPLIVTEEFMNVHHIDYVLHSFSDQVDAEKQSEFYKVPRERNAFIQVPYSTGTSTSDIIKKIKSIG